MKQNVIQATGLSVTYEILFYHDALVNQWS